MTNAAEKAYKACERFCNPQAVASFEIKKEENNAECAIAGKIFRGSGSVEVKVCACTSFINVSATDIVDPLL